MIKESLIDTDILSDFFKGNPDIIAKIDEHVRFFGFINFSIITYYEIMKGKLPLFEEFVSYNKILPISLEVAQTSAFISAELRKNSLEIRHFDTLIAGTAIVNNLQLVTNNVRHFCRIPNLQIVNWKKN